MDPGLEVDGRLLAGNNNKSNDTGEPAWISSKPMASALRCELSGDGDRTLVLVHEMGGSLESWDEVAPRFAAVASRPAL